MQLFYSGAQLLNYPQPNLLKSFGGYISSSLVPNSDRQNIFSSISAIEVQAGQLTQVVALFLKNTLTSNVLTSTIYHEPTPNANYKFELGVQQPTNGQISSYGNIFNVPTDIQFQEFVYDPSNSIDERISLGPINVGASLGLFFKRTILNPNQKSWQQLYDEFVTVEALKQRYEGGDNTLTQDELRLISAKTSSVSFNLKLDYTT